MVPDGCPVMVEKLLPVVVPKSRMPALTSRMPAEVLSWVTVTVLEACMTTLSMMPGIFSPGLTGRSGLVLQVLKLSQSPSLNEYHVPISWSVLARV